MTRSNLYLGMISPFFDSFHQPDTETIITIATYMVPGGALFVLVVIPLTLLFVVMPLTLLFVLVVMPLTLR